MIVYRMLYAVAVGLPILVAAYLGASVLRRHGRSERWVWLTALGFAVALPAIYLMRPLPPVPTMPVAELQATVAPLEGADPASPALGLRFPNVVFVPGADDGIGVDEALLLMWLLASSALALRWIVSSRRLARLTRSWRTRELDGTSVWVTPDAGPAVAGVIRAGILVPDWLLALPDEQRSLVLLHEKEHLRARDPLLMGLSRIARILTPWNPVVWAASAGLLRAVEADCDRRVLRHGPEVRAYCDTLLAISARKPTRLVGAAAFAEPRIPLKKRIIAMTTPPRPMSALGGLALLGLAALFVFGSCGVPLPTERDADPRQNVIPTEDPNWVHVVVVDNGVIIDGVPHAIDEVSTVMGERVSRASLPLVTNLEASWDTPYRIMDRVQRELVEAGALRVVYSVDPPPAGADRPLALVMPESLEQYRVSLRNVLTLDVQASGEVEVRMGAAESTRRLRARDIEELWRENVANNPNLIASVHFQPEATFAQVMAVIDALHDASAQRISLWGSIAAQ